MFETLTTIQSHPAAFTRFPAIIPVAERKRNDSVRVQGVLLEPDKPVSVGREATLEIVPHLIWMSRKHLELKVDIAGNLWIRDLNSKAGTYINDFRIDSEWTIVHDNDEIWLGCRGMRLNVTRG